MKSNKLWLLVVLLLGLTLTARAQVNSGMIRGIVRDSAGAVVPGARTPRRQNAPGAADAD